MPGADFPQKILAAAAKARQEGSTLRLVADEVGCPTYASDLAGAIVGLVEQAGFAHRRGFGGIHHVVNSGRASRAEWAREVLRIAGLDVPTQDVPMTTWPRPSTPPAWGVLEPTPLPGGPLRSWQDALAEYWPQLPRE
jgi:dTDP-4-dehydrorhamnose reductase